jgi:peroxiredoxin
LCDTNRSICVAYGACDGVTDKTAKRITYVIGPDGNIVQAHETVDAKAHPELLLATL